MSIRFNPPFRLRPVFSSKIIAPNLEPAVFGTNSGSINEPLMGGSFFCGERMTVEFRVCSIRIDPLLRLRPVFISKIIAPNRGSLVLGRTNSGSANEPLMGGSLFLWVTDDGDFRVCSIRIDPLFACAPFLAPKWIRWLGCVARARGAPAEWGASPLRRLAKPMRLPPKFPRMEFYIYPNKMPTHFILPESLIL